MPTWLFALRDADARTSSGHRRCALLRIRRFPTDPTRPTRRHVGSRVRANLCLDGKHYNDRRARLLSLLLRLQCSLQS